MPGCSLAPSSLLVWMPPEPILEEARPLETMRVGCRLLAALRAPQQAAPLKQAVAAIVAVSLASKRLEASSSPAAHSARRPTR